MIILYKILTLIVFVAAIPFFPFLILFSKKRRASLLPRLGMLTGLEPLEKKKKRYWVHALSVGEVKSAVPLVNALGIKEPSPDIYFTASTKTGVETAQRLFLKKGREQVNQVAYFPYDLGFSIHRIFKKINPDMIILVETDLWPNFLYEMGKNKVPVVLINARLSERSLNGYLKIKFFSRKFFSFLTRILVQSDLDKKRFMQLGLKEDKIAVTGNIKFDQPFEKMDTDSVNRMKLELSIDPDSRIVLAGSTHTGEESVLLAWYAAIQNSNPDIVLIIAPRNPERSRELDQAFKLENRSSILLSEIHPQMSAPDVIFVDKMGLLSKLYAICDIAFVGGSLVKKGGHNPLEPAVYAKPVLVGSDMSDFLQISERMKESGGLIMAAEERDLAARLNHLLDDEKGRKQMGEDNFKVFNSHSGAVNKIISIVEQVRVD